MLDGVALGGTDDRLVVGAGDTQVKGGDRFRTDAVLAGHIQARLQLDMVDGKASDLLHSRPS